jgi:hypothetical protein
MNNTPNRIEESSAQETAGAPHISPIQPTGEHGQSGGPPKERSPWDKFLARLRGVRLVKSATKLRNLRVETNAWYPILQSNRDDIQGNLDVAVDPLDQAAYKEELAAIKDKIGKLDDGLTAINNRAKALVGDAEA